MCRLRTTTTMRPTLILAGFFLAAAAAGAQPGGGRDTPPPGPPRIDVVKELGVSSDTATRVEAILEAGRERMRAAREQTRQELAQVLTPDQLARLDAAMPRPPGGGPGPGQARR